MQLFHSIYFYQQALNTNLIFFKKVEVVEVQEVQAPEVQAPEAQAPEAQAPEVQAMEVPVQKAAQPIPEIKKARPSVH